MRSSQHHSDGGGRGGASGMNNQAEGGGAGGGESGVGWWRRCPWSAMECNGACVSRWCRRKPHWPTVLPILGVSWIIATFLTGFGMYMVICHAPTHDLHVFTLRSYQNNVSELVTASLPGPARCVLLLPLSFTSLRQFLVLSVLVYLASAILKVVLVVLSCHSNRLSRVPFPYLPRLALLCFDT